jgi:hypothetical protein
MPRYWFPFPEHKTFLAFSHAQKKTMEIKHESLLQVP